MELPCELTLEQRCVYDDAVSLWQDLRMGLAAALVKTNTTNRELWKPFWSAQQRFFKLLCVSMKACHLCHGTAVAPIDQMVLECMQLCNGQRICA